MQYRSLREARIGLDAVSPQALLARAIRESRLGLMEAAAASAQQVIHSAPAAASAVLRLDARIRLVWIQFQNGEHEAARRTAALAVRKAAAIGDRTRESLARSCYARVLAEGSEVVEAANEVVAALRLSRWTDDPLSRSVACVNLAIICSRLALYEAAVDMSHQAVEQAERADDPEAYAHALSNYGSLHADYLYRYRLVPEAERDSYLDLAIRESRHATDYAQTQEDGEMQRLSGYNLVEFLLMRGDLAGAEAAWARVEMAAGAPSRRSQVQRGHVRSLLLLGQGDPAALGALEESLERCLAYPFRELALFASEHRSRLLAEAAQYEAAFREHQRFHKLFCEQNNQDHSRHMQYSIILDQIEEMRALVAAENERVARLAQQHASLSSQTERLARESLEDALTGLANRRQLDQLLGLLTVENRAYAIAILDLDHFKRVNDLFTHAVGDRVLRRVAEIMRIVLAGAAAAEGPGLRLAVRLGGEEFAIALAGAEARAITRDEACAVCEALREAIAAEDWAAVTPGLAVTASLGLAMSEEAPDAAGRMWIADARLYDAKHAGRNRVAWDESGRAARDRARSDGWAPEAEDKEEPDFPSEPATSARAITL
jgi:two-component system cell cycle response regulator